MCSARSRVMVTAVQSAWLCAERLRVDGQAIHLPRRGDKSSNPPAYVSRDSAVTSFNSHRSCPVGSQPPALSSSLDAQESMAHGVSLYLHPDHTIPRTATTRPALKNADLGPVGSVPGAGELLVRDCPAGIGNRAHWLPEPTGFLVVACFRSAVPSGSWLTPFSVTKRLRSPSAFNACKSLQTQYPPLIL
jgi:hypothetical protein